LGAGPDRGSITLLMGPAGSRKSTIAVQYAAAAAARGEHAVIFAFDESLITLVARTEALGTNFKEITETCRMKVRQIVCQPTLKPVRSRLRCAGRFYSPYSGPQSWMPESKNARSTLDFGRPRRQLFEAPVGIMSPAKHRRS
jgi:RecA/RadA recombinase